MLLHPMNPPEPFPVHEPSTPEGQEAAKLHAAMLAAYNVIRGIEADGIAAVEKTQALQAEREDALRAAAASGHPSSPEAEKLSKKLAEVQEVANSGDWRARHAGATDGYNATAAAYGEYVDLNWKALAAEVEAEGNLVAARIEKAADDFAAAIIQDIELRRSLEQLLPGALKAEVRNVMPDAGELHKLRRIRDTLKVPPVAPKEAWVSWFERERPGEEVVLAQRAERDAKIKAQQDAKLERLRKRTASQKQGREARRRAGRLPI
jgi:hypothetical protein